MQIASLGDKLHEMPKPVFWWRGGGGGRGVEKRKYNLRLSSAELAQRVIKVNPFSPADQNSFANSVDPDEAAHNEPSRHEHSLPMAPLRRVNKS